MSIQFDEPMNPEAHEKLKEMFTDRIAAIDEKMALIDGPMELNLRAMTELANTAKQPVSANIHGEGEIVTMADGTKYRVTPQGWRKMDPTGP